MDFEQDLSTRREVQKLTQRIAELERTLASCSERSESNAEAERLALAFDQGPLGIYLFDESLRVIKANRSYCNMLGLDEEQVVGHGVCDFTLPEDRDVEGAAIENLVEHAVPQSGYTKRLCHADGSTVWVEVTVARIWGREAAKLYGVAMVENVTARCQAETSLKQREAELAHVARLSTIGEMVAGLAHELNQPLTAIANLAHASVRSLDSRQAEGLDDIRQWLATIAEQANRAGDMIHRLRRFVRKGDMPLGPVDVNASIEDVLALLMFDIRHIGAKIRSDLESGLPEIIGDKAQIQQVLVNVLRNSFDSLRAVPQAERRVLVSTRRTEGGVTIQIVDQGPGCPPELLGQVFDAFFTTKKEGIGMGLAISRTIVEAHGGRIALSSAPERGVMVRIDLPAGGNGS